MYRTLHGMKSRQIMLSIIYLKESDEYCHTLQKTIEVYTYEMYCIFL